MVYYAFARVFKLKTDADVQASEAHCRRLVPVPNADSDRLSLNFEYDGDNGTQEGIMSLAPTCLGRIRAIEKQREYITPRKDSIKMLEVLMTAPPDLFRGVPLGEMIRESTNGKRTEPKRGSLFDKWLHGCFRFVKDFFKDQSVYTNVVGMFVHLDETTPHIHILVMPVHKDRYNAKHYIGNRQKLRHFQNECHKWISHYVPEVPWTRGIPKGESRRSHTLLKDWYRLLERADRFGLYQDVQHFVESRIQDYNLQPVRSKSAISDYWEALRPMLPGEKAKRSIRPESTIKPEHALNQSHSEGPKAADLRRKMKI